MKKIVRALNILMGSCAAVYFGYVIFIFFHHYTHPGRYAYYSAPWYTGILVYGVYTLIALAVCFVVKIFLSRYFRKKQGDPTV